MEKDGGKESPVIVAQKKRLSAVRDALLALHKTLIESERIGYETTIGPIQSPNHFLQLLTSDPWFVWMRPISQLIVAMDEALDSREPLTVDAIADLSAQTWKLLVASEEGHDFHRHYFDALQRDPDVVLAHAEVTRLREPGGSAASHRPKS